MTKRFQFSISATDGKARTGIIRMRRGEIRTPAFMPVGTAATVQALAFTSTYAAVGPAMYYVGISIKGTTARLRTVPAYCGGSLFAGSVSQTHATVAAVTEPVTFTADKAPVVVLY